MDCERSVILSIKGAKKIYNTSLGVSKVLKGIDLNLFEGESFGLIGESGSGKSTLAKCIVMLDTFSSGICSFNGVDMSTMSKHDINKIRREMQIVFQESSSLNPQHRVSDIILEPLYIHFPELFSEYKKRLIETAGQVGLPEALLDSFPHQLSGGQKQRVSIARAIILKPRFLVCDEPLSALDMSIQSQIINLLSNLKKQLNLTCLFISHDLSVVRHMCDRIGVMYNGLLIEIGDKDMLSESPKHPYTKFLVDAVPIPDPVIERSRPRKIIEGEPPSLFSVPRGCCFIDRCPFSYERCRNEKPKLLDIGDGCEVACHLFDT